MTIMEKLKNLKWKCKNVFPDTSVLREQPNLALFAPDKGRIGDVNSFGALN